MLLAIDATAWAALTALIAECPVLPDALLAAERRARTIDPARFEFIAQSAQLAAVRDFLESLPVLLSS